MNIQKTERAQALNKAISPEHLLDHTCESPSNTSARNRCGWLWRKFQQPHSKASQHKNNKSTPYGDAKLRLRSALLSFFLITGLLTSCGSSGDKNPSGTEILKYYAKASNTDESDGFGGAVALSSDGNTLAIGAIGEASSAKNTDATPNQEDDNAPFAGAVYVFTRTGAGAGWSQQAYLKASNTDLADLFGTSVALSGDGNTLAIGSIGEASNAKNTDTTPDQTGNSVSGAGAVYVFTRTGASWSQEIYLKAPNPDARDNFGVSIALSGDGNTLAVGAIGEESNAKNTDVTPNQADNSALGAGAVYVFTRARTSWSQETYLKASNTDAGDGFGGAVALSSDGNTLAVSAIGEASNAKNTDATPDQTDNSASDAGAVYVFVRTGASWSQESYLKASNTDAGDGFGYSVALSGDSNSLAVGANGEASSAKSGDATPNQEDNSASSAGAVYVFTRTEASWSQEAYLKASNTDARDEFGAFVALDGDGDALAVSAIGEASSAKSGDATPNQADNSAAGAGAVYVFTRTEASWSQKTYLKASNTDANDLFGASVILSDDGNTLATGAIGEKSNAKSTDATPNQANNSTSSAGAVYIY